MKVLQLDSSFNGREEFEFFYFVGLSFTTKIKLWNQLKTLEQTSFLISWSHKINCHNTWPVFLNNLTGCHQVLLRTIQVAFQTVLPSFFLPFTSSCTFLYWHSTGNILQSAYFLSSYAVFQTTWKLNVTPHTRKRTMECHSSTCKIAAHPSTPTSRGSSCLAP